MKEPIEFEVLWWDDNQSQLNELGVRPPLDEVSTRPITFYSIDHIAAYTEGGKEYCTIWSGGQEYIVRMTYAFVKKVLVGYKSLFETWIKENKLCYFIELIHDDDFKSTLSKILIGKHSRGLDKCIKEGYQLNYEFDENIYEYAYNYFMKNGCTLIDNQ